MILTQTIGDLGFPPAKVVGAIMFEVEGPTDTQGYGMGGVEGAMDEANQFVERKYGTEALLANAKFERVTASAHPSYGRVRIRVTGDLYIMTPEMTAVPTENRAYTARMENTNG
jgi:hypothetical protein